MLLFVKNKKKRNAPRFITQTTLFSAPEHVFFFFFSKFQLVQAKLTGNKGRGRCSALIFLADIREVAFFIGVKTTLNVSLNCNC